MIEVTCAIIFRRNKLLLTQRNGHSQHPFQWEFPGGKVNPGETEVQCIHREISEELGIEIEIAEKLIPVTFDYGFKKIRLIPFLCHLKEGEIVLHEHNDFEWLNVNELEAKNISGADREVLRVPENQKLLQKYSREKMNDA